MNALSDSKVAEYVQGRFIATYMKVGTFQIVGDRKVGGNVASYFCLIDGTVLHAVAGPANGATFLAEARWAWEIRKKALTHATDLVTGTVDPARWRSEVQKAHEERFAAIGGQQMARKLKLARQGDAKQEAMPGALPRNVRQEAQVHWLMATRPLERIDQVYPIVWQEVLGEKLSSLPVAMR